MARRRRASKRSNASTAPPPPRAATSLTGTPSRRRRSTAAVSTAGQRSRRMNGSAPAMRRAGLAPSTVRPGAGASRANGPARRLVIGRIIPPAPRTSLGIAGSKHPCAVAKGRLSLCRNRRSRRRSCEHERIAGAPARASSAIAIRSCAEARRDALEEGGGDFTIGLAAERDRSRAGAPRYREGVFSYAITRRRCDGRRERRFQSSGIEAISRR